MKLLSTLVVALSLAGAPIALAGGSFGPTLDAAEKIVSYSSNHAKDRVLDCNNVLDALEDWQWEQERFEDQIVDYQYETGGVMGDWYRELRRYEGRTVNIAIGAFRNIRKSAEATRDSAREMDRFFSQSREDLSEITDLLGRCFAP